MSESRHTFTIPPGFEAVRDHEGRATGEIHPVAPATAPQGELVESAAKRICLATGLDWDSLEDRGDIHSDNSGCEAKGWFRYLARAALPNTTGEAE